MSADENSTIFRAPYILPIEFPPISDGAIKVKKNRIVSVSKFSDMAKNWKDRVIFLQDCLIMPGFVNSHTHLELSCLKDAVKERKSFTKWIKEVIDAKKKISERDYKESIRNGIIESIKGGITTFGDITGTGYSLKIMKKLGVRGISFHEVIGFSNKDTGNAFYNLITKVAASKVYSLNENETVGIGVSPHSPYSVSPSLIKLVCGFAKKLNLPVSIHLSETMEEVKFLKTGTGPFRELLSDLGSFDNAWEVPGCSPLKYLKSLNIVNSDMSIVHFNFFDDSDLKIAKKNKIKVIFCPKSNNKWFSRKISPFMTCFKESIPISIGTDSLASNDSYNIFNEMRMLKSLYPLFPVKKILQIATSGGAFCLGMEKETGSFKKGKLADFIAIRIPKKINLKNLAEYVIAESKEVSLSVINGRTVYSSMPIPQE